jgi:DNA-binding response OmpR family regulator
MLVRSSREEVTKTHCGIITPTRVLRGGRRGEKRVMERGKVVVIDDSPLVRRLAELALEEEGYKVYTAEDGEEGLKIAEEVMPSVILVDFIMPRMSGYQFCKLARESQLLQDVPIILITGKGEDVGRKFIEKFAIADYFIKPFKSETLVEKVASIVDSSHVEEPAGFTLRGVEGPAEQEAVEEPYRIPVEEPEREEGGGVAAEPYTLEVETGPAEQEAVEEPYRIPLEEFTGEQLFAEDTAAHVRADVARDQETFAAPPVFSEPRPMTEASFGADMQLSVERALARYIHGEFPFLVHRSVLDMLKLSGVTRGSSTALAGEFSRVSAHEIFRLIETNRMTGRLFAYGPLLSAEVYFLMGRLGWASLSGPGAPDTERGGDCKTSGEAALLSAVSAVLGLEYGSFFFECLPSGSMPDIVQPRMSTSAFIVESARQVDEEIPSILFRDTERVFVRLFAREALAALHLSDEESRIVTLLDGERNLEALASESGIEENRVKKIMYVLTKAGAVRER